MATVYLEFVATKSLLGSIIRWGTMGDVDHVQFITSDGKRLGAQLGSGVSLSDPVSEKLIKRFKVEATDQVLAYAYSQIGKPYDLFAVLAIAFRVTLGRCWKNPKDWFCSELVAASFSHAGCPLLLEDNIKVITPRDLMLSPYLIPILADND